MSLALAANDPRKVAALVNMGFTEQQAKDALDGCSGTVERAVPWSLLERLKAFERLNTLWPRPSETPLPASS